MKDISHEGKQQGKDDEHYQDHLVLLLEIGHGAFSDVLRYFFHGRSTFVLLPHLAVKQPREEQCQDGCYRDKIE